MRRPETVSIDGGRLSGCRQGAQLGAVRGGVRQGEDGRVLEGHERVRGGGGAQRPVAPAREAASGRGGVVAENRGQRAGGGSGGLRGSSMGPLVVPCPV